MFKALREQWKRAGEEAKGAYLKKELASIYQKIEQSRRDGYPLDGYVMNHFAHIHDEAIRILGSPQSAPQNEVKDGINEILGNGKEFL